MDIICVYVSYIFQRSGRIEEEIQMLQLKLKRIEGIPFGGRRTKIARSQGKKVQITVEQEISRWKLLLFFFFFHPHTLFFNILSLLWFSINAVY